MSYTGRRKSEVASVQVPLICTVEHQEKDVYFLQLGRGKLQYNHELTGKKEKKSNYYHSFNHLKPSLQFERKTIKPNPKKKKKL